MICIVKTNIAYHVANQVKISGNFAIYHPIAKLITKNIPKILMFGK